MRDSRFYSWLTADVVVGRYVAIIAIIAILRAFVESAVIVLRWAF